MKYGFSGSLIQLLFFPFVKKFYKREFSNENTNAFMKRVKKEYKEMIFRTPGLNGNDLEFNLYFAAFIFSINKADSKNMNAERINQLVDEVYKSKLMINAHKNKKCVMFDEAELNKREKTLQESSTSNFEMKWAGTVKKGIDEFYQTYTECGICKLAAKEGMSNLVPCLCRTDFENYSNDGGVLFRTKTLAYGDEICNFHVVKKNSQALENALKNNEDKAVLR